jgi:hypothetical protein
MATTSASPRIGSFTKSLKHNARGEVDPDAYEALLRALRSSRHADFEAIATGGHFGTADRARQRRLVNPQASYAFDLEGIDSLKGFEPPAPAFSSAEEAGEMVELYWMALLRDVNFRNFDTNPVAQAAAADLSRLSDFRGPKIGGRVTTHLFRDRFRVFDGPYFPVHNTASQFRVSDNRHAHEHCGGEPGLYDHFPGLARRAERHPAHSGAYTGGSVLLPKWA